MCLYFFKKFVRMHWLFITFLEVRSIFMSRAVEITLLLVEGVEWTPPPPHNSSLLPAQFSLGWNVKWLKTCFFVCFGQVRTREPFDSVGGCAMGALVPGFLRLLTMFASPCWVFWYWAFSVQSTSLDSRLPRTPGFIFQESQPPLEI